MLMRCRAIEQPCIAGFGREQDQPTNRDDASVVLGRPVLDVADLIGQPNAAAFHDPLARATLDRFSIPTGSRGVCHGPVHPTVRQLAGLRLPLLRPHRHIRLPQRAVAARAGGELLPSSRWRSGPTMPPMISWTPSPQTGAAHGTQE